MCDTPWPKVSREWGGRPIWGASHLGWVGGGGEGGEEGRVLAGQWQLQGGEGMKKCRNVDFST